MVAAQYIPNGTVAESIPEGRVLCHNTVQHAAGTRSGVRGFRAWTQTEVPERFAKCRCGWSGLPHYARSVSAKGEKK